MVRYGRRNEDHQLPCIMGKIVLFLVVRGGSAGIVLRERLAKKRSEGAALVLGDPDKTPGRELAMIGSSSGKGQNALKLGAARARTDQLARLCRAAGSKKGNDR